MPYRTPRTKLIGWRKGQPTAPSNQDLFLAVCFPPPTSVSLKSIIRTENKQVGARTKQSTKLKIVCLAATRCDRDLVKLQDELLQTKC